MISFQTYIMWNNGHFLWNWSQATGNAPQVNIGSDNRVVPPGSKPISELMSGLMLIHIYGVTKPQMLTDQAIPISPESSQRAHGAIMRSLWRENDVVTFWRWNDVIVASRARWVSTNAVRRLTNSFRELSKLRDEVSKSSHRSQIWR